MADLSIIVVARNEEFLQHTVNDIMENIRGDTEVIVILDEYWPDPPLMDNKRVTVVHHTQFIGQRAAMNEGARISQSRFVMKVDAHCAFDAGFDVKLMNYCKYDWTVIPLMFNLHVFDWKCDKCGNHTYQGRYPKECPKCDNKTDFSKEIVWKRRRGTAMYSMRFDKDLIFQYWRERKTEGDIVDTMSFLGACWFMHRDRFWELEGLDENHGFWGQVGTEVACKTWLSGGKLCVNKKTWFAHMFRSQFGWPYHITRNDVEKAREYSRDLWLNNKWHKAKYDLQWLIDKFAPVPTWETQHG